MTYNIPAHGEPNWDGKLDPSLQYLKDTAEAAETPTGAQAKATAAQNAAISAAATDATNKANAAQNNAITSAASDATTKANAVQSSLNSHVGNLANPHSVTKAQLGLGNVDNTADAAKPVSAAQQTALNLKQNHADMDADVSAQVTSGTQTRAALSAAYAEVVSLYKYGFVGDGVADDTAAFQAALNAAPSGSWIDVPHTGNAKITSPLSITKPVTIAGRSKGFQRLMTSGNGCFTIAAGVEDVQIKNLSILNDTAYASPSAIVAITADGTAASQISRLLIEDVKIDNFQTCVLVRNVVDCTLNRVTMYNNLIGLDVFGLTVNNFVTNCYFSAIRGANSRCVRFTGTESPSDGTAVVSEGWMFTGNLFANAEMLIEMWGVRYFNFVGNVIDWAALYCVYLATRAGVPAAGHTFSGNYFAIGGSDANAAVNDANTATPPHKNAYINNTVQGYTGTDPWSGLAMTRPYGIHLAGSASASLVRGNRFYGFTDADVIMDSSGSIVTDNDLSPTTPGLGNVYSTVANLVDRNNGVIYSTAVADTAPYTRNSAGQKTVVASAAPAAGTWTQGDRVVRTPPAVGSPRAWVCTAGGTPGTWVSEGNL